MLTIKHFSRITAIPESTLRFYEQEGVLLPAGRAPNGYRLYAAEQILEAKFLYSLRLAAIPIDEVGDYRTATDPEHRNACLDRWEKDLEERIQRLTMARRYVETLRSGVSLPVHLQVTERHQVAWFTHDAPVGHFKEATLQRIRQLNEAAVPFDDAYFRWLQDLGDGWVRGQVGFRITGPCPLSDAEVEEQPACLTLSMEHRDAMEGIRETYRRLFAFMEEHGWEARGCPVERYPGAPEWFVEILVPILYLEGSAARD